MQMLRCCAGSLPDLLGHLNDLQLHMAPDDMEPSKMPDAIVTSVRQSRHHITGICTMYSGGVSTMKCELWCLAAHMHC